MQTETKTIENVLPPQVGAETLSAKIDFIKSYIHAQTDGLDGHIEGEDYWGEGVIVKVQEAPMVRTPGNTCMFVEQRTIVQNNAGLELSDRLHIGIFGSSGLDEFTLDFNEDGSGTFDLYTVSGSEDDIEDERVPLDTVEGNHLYEPYFEKLYEFLIELDFLEKKDYDRHPIPSDMTFKALSDERKKQASDQLKTEYESIVAALLPTHEFTAQEDSWLASNPVWVDNRLYSVLYREIDEELRPFVVYTSVSQAVWRLLPRLGNSKNENWHDKGVGGEDVMNLPISMQRSLWEYVESTGELAADSETFFRSIKTITNSNYDVFIAGADTEAVWLTNGYDEELSDEWLPDPSSVESTFRFSSFTNGEVDAQVLRSQNDQLNYLVLRKKGDDLPWIASVEFRDASMFDSFVIDRHPHANEPLCAPRIEYDYSKDNPRGYIDNRERLLGSRIVKSVLGKTITE